MDLAQNFYGQGAAASNGASPPPSFTASGAFSQSASANVSVVGNPVTWVAVIVGVALLLLHLE